MREYDDDVRRYMPVLQRIIILVAVIVAVPVVLWTITTFVRTYVGQPRIPTFQRAAASPSADTSADTALANTNQPPGAPLDLMPANQTAAAAPTAPSPMTPPATADNQSQPAAAPVAAPPQTVATATPMNATPMSTAPMSTAPMNATPMSATPMSAPPSSPSQNTSAQATPAQPLPAPMSNPTVAALPPAPPPPPAAMPDAPGGATGTTSAFAWPNSPVPPGANAGAADTQVSSNASDNASTDTASEALPAVAPISGHVPLPRRRPNVIAMVQPAPAAPGTASAPAAAVSGGVALAGVPLPRARPSDAPEAPETPPDTNNYDRDTAH